MKRPRELAELLLDKAGQDEALLDEVLGAERVADETIGFHCQQAAEKLLKALLSCRGVRYRKTHDLRELMDLLADARHPVPDHLAEIDTLTPYASLFQYEAVPPKASLDRKKAREWVRSLRKWITSEVSRGSPD